MLPVKQQVFAFEEDDVCFPRTKQEFRDFQRFDRALKDAQTGNKEQLTKNVNLAAQIAAGLSSADGVRHVVSRICLVSKDDTTRKETAIYAADSIMRHVASSADLQLLERYERHLGCHLRNIFKRALRIDASRRWLADRFLNKILPKWADKGWFHEELPSIVEVVHKSAPSVRRPDRLSQEALAAKPEFHGTEEDEDFMDTEGIEPTENSRVPPPSPMAPTVMGGAFAKAGCPPTPMQPSFLVPPGTPGVPGGMTPMLKQGTPEVMRMVPATPNVAMTVPRTPAPFGAPGTPFGRIPMTPGGIGAPMTPGAVPMTPMPGRIPMTPGGQVPSTPRAPGMPQTPGMPPPPSPGNMSGVPASPGMPLTPGAAATQPFTPRPFAAQPFTPGGGVQPFTPRPGGAPQPFTPRGPQPFTPGAGPAQPFTPAAGPAQPFTPAAQPFTPAPQPFTPAGSAQPFTPRGPAPRTPAGGPQPFTPAGPPPSTPGAPQPFTPAGPPPATPGAPQPFTPMHGPSPFTPAGAPPATPLPGPGTPGWVPVPGGSAAPVTPMIGTFRPPGTPRSPGTPAAGTPGFMPIPGGHMAPVTPRPMALGGFAVPTTPGGGGQPLTPGGGGQPLTPGGGGQPLTPGGQPSTPGRFGPQTPGYIASPGGNVAPETPLPSALLKSAPSTPAGSKRQEEEDRDVDHPVPSVPTEHAEPATGGGEPTPVVSAGGEPTPLLPPTGAATPLMSGLTTPATPGLGNVTPVVEQPIPSVPSVPSVDASQPVPSVPSVPSAPSSVLEAVGDDGLPRSAKNSPFIGPSETGSGSRQVPMPGLGEATPLLLSTPPGAKSGEDDERAPEVKRRRLFPDDEEEPVVKAVLPMEDSQAYDASQRQSQ